MDSLLANYASSDEEEDQQQPQPQKTLSSSLFSSLPKPQSSSSLFSSLPPPKSHLSTPPNPQQDQKVSNVSSGLFSSLPAPKSQSDSAPISGSQKRVVQFRPPVIQSSSKSAGKDEEDDNDDDDDEYLDKKRPQVINPSGSFKSFISSMPAPMNSATLGVSGSGGSGRRSIVETSVSILKSDDVYKVEKEVGSVQDSSNSNDRSVSGNLGGDVANLGEPGEGYVGYEGYENYGSYGGYEGYGSYGSDGQHDQNAWANAPSTWVAPEPSGQGLVESVVRMSGKRGRDKIPTEIVEVSQDDLMKNRPRQDQSKLTGIAFGPAYQPASSGGGGKPTKLHKRKHQIGSLYFDMKQKETELSERRAKGMLTKAETHAKYGW